jgi:Tol biopolymer transport system component
MPDIHERLEVFNDLEPPELWSEVQNRKPRPPGDEGPSRAKTIGIVLLALAIATGGIGLAVRAFTQSSNIVPVVPTVSNGKIAFARLSGADWQIDMVNPDGTSAAMLASVSGDAFHPAWSPDGHRVLFDRQFGGRMQIYVVNDDGTGLTRLTDEPGWNYLPAWSSDGTKIAFVSTRDGNDEIYVMNADGSNQVRLTNSPDEDLSPSWAPDGSQIAFQSNRDRSNEIYVMHADGTSVTRLTDDPATFDGDPAWSPDGRTITFTSVRNGAGGLYTMNPDGSDAVQVANNPKSGQPLDPAWSPDGSSIAYTARVGGTNEILILDLSTLSQRALPGTVGDVCCPSWQPVPSELTDPSPSQSASTEFPPVRECAASGVNTFFHCPESRWAKQVALDAGYMVRGQTGSAYIVKGHGAEFFFWGAPTSEERPGADLAGYEVVETVDSVTVYTDGVRFHWRIDGLSLWVEAGPNRSDRVTAVTLRPLVRSSANIPFAGT